MQRSGTEAIRTQIQHSKPKRRKTNITNSNKSKKTCFPFYMQRSFLESLCQMANYKPNGES